jgi:2-dehydro-3-deoxyphosphogluconate aldolase / (4S)-4-hydroxy-2-oxoglutarate aldolase
MNVDLARRCLDAGSRFLTSPTFNPEVVEFAVKHEVVVFPGALTPTEVMTAWQAGSDFVKIYPCWPLGGPSYVSALKSPFPEVRLIAAGGVTQQTAADFIHAGAVAVGIGRDLVWAEAVKRREHDWIHELAHRFLKIVSDARGQGTA